MHFIYNHDVKVFTYFKEFALLFEIWYGMTIFSLNFHRLPFQLLLSP